MGTIAIESCPREKDEQRTVLDAIESRRAIRAFRSTPVPLSIVRRILEAASRAPSGVNMQPWSVYVVTGKSMKSLSDKSVAAFLENPAATGERTYYPTPMPEPYRARQVALGKALYGSLGIARGDRDGMLRQMTRNWRFFDAPVGMIFTIDVRLELGSWIDYGIFLQSIMIAARGFGLHTCPQEAWCTYPAAVREELGFGADEIVVCGMALGVADMERAENRFEVSREVVDQFATFLGFEIAQHDQ